jgi:hypothetical protein
MLLGSDRRMIVRNRMEVEPNNRCNDQPTSIRDHRVYHCNIRFYVKRDNGKQRKYFDCVNAE